jgi:predicted phage tail protein
VARIEELRAEVFDPNTGLPATASALSLLSSQVNNPATGLVAASNAITSLVSSVPGASAEGLLRIFTEASASGEDVRIALSAATSGSVGPASAAMYVTAGGGNSEILMVANRIAFITSPTGTKRGLLVVDGDNVFIDTARIRNLSVANMSADFIDALDISAESILSQNANITGTLHVGTGSTGVFIQGPNNRILIVD